MQQHEGEFILTFIEDIVTAMGEKGGIAVLPWHTGGRIMHDAALQVVFDVGLVSGSFVIVDWYLDINFWNYYLWRSGRRDSAVADNNWRRMGGPGRLDAWP